MSISWRIDKGGLLYCSSDSKIYSLSLDSSNDEPCEVASHNGVPISATQYKTKEGEVMMVSAGYDGCISFWKCGTSSKFQLQGQYFNQNPIQYFDLAANTAIASTCEQAIYVWKLDNLQENYDPNQ